MADEYTSPVTGPDPDTGDTSYAWSWDYISRDTFINMMFAMLGDQIQAILTAVEIPDQIIADGSRIKIWLITTRLPSSSDRPGDYGFLSILEPFGMTGYLRTYSADIDDSYALTDVEDWLIYHWLGSEAEWDESTDEIPDVGYILDGELVLGGELTNDSIDYQRTSEILLPTIEQYERWSAFVGPDDSSPGPFSFESFMSFYWQIELINFYDTLVTENYYNSHKHMWGTELAAPGEPFVVMDTNIILNYESVYCWNPRGETLGVDRTNPNVTSNKTDYPTFMNEDREEYNPMELPMTMSDEAIKGCEKRYKLLSAVEDVRDSWVDSMCIDLQNTGYASINIRRFAVKMQRSEPLSDDSIITIYGSLTSTTSEEATSAAESVAETTAMGAGSSTATTTVSAGPSGYGGY